MFTYTEAIPILMKIILQSQDEQVGYLSYYIMLLMFCRLPRKAFKLGFYVYLRPSEFDNTNLKEHSDNDTVYPSPLQFSKK